jgi:hypothetical protein
MSRGPGSRLGRGSLLGRLLLEDLEVPQVLGELAEVALVLNEGEVRLLGGWRR